MKKVYINFDEYESMINQLASLIKESGATYSKIFTIPRGGLIPAASLAYKLGIKEVILDDSLITFNTLIVDDISDSGQTLLPYKDHDIACLCFKTGAVIIPKYCVKEYPKSVWVVFPWEGKDEAEMRDRDSL